MAVLLKSKLTGVEAFQEAIKDFSQRLKNKIIAEGLEAAASPLVARARTIAPRDTGALARSIGFKRLKNRRGRVRAMVSTDASNFIGGAFYAPFLELGFKKQPTYRTDDGRVFSVKRNKGTPTQFEGLHFMKRAANETMSQQRIAFETAWRMAVDREAIAVRRRQMAKERREAEAAKKAI